MQSSLANTFSCYCSQKVKKWRKQVGL